MEQNEDSMLRSLFEGIALRTAGVAGACKYVQTIKPAPGIKDYCVYHVCKACVYTGIPTEQEMSLPHDRAVPFDKDELPGLQLRNIDKVRPENVLVPPGLPVSGKDFPELFNSDRELYFMPVYHTAIGIPGIWVLADAGEGSTLLRVLSFNGDIALGTMSPYLYMMPPELLAIPGITRDQIDSLKPSLARVKQAEMLALMLGGGGGQMYVAMLKATESASKRMLAHIESPSGDVFRGDAWDGACFKRIIKETRMKALCNPVDATRATRQPRPQSAETLAVPAEEPEVKQAVEAPVAMPKQDPASMAADLLSEAPVVTPEEIDAEIAAVVREQVEAAANGPEIVEEPVQDPTPQPEDKPRQKRVRKPATAIGFDYSDVLEYLGAQVSPGQDQEKALEEVRTLRDLIISATRRQTNIVSQLVKESSDAVEKLAALQAILGK